MPKSKQAVDKIKVVHREELMKLKKVHAIVVHNKNVEIKIADVLVAGYEETFSELLEEMREEKQKTNDYAKKYDFLRKKASIAHSKFAQHKLIAESQHDGYRDEQLNAMELQCQVNEYEVMIDYLYEEMDKRERDFDSIVKYIDQYYTEASYNSKPRVICKHYVPNREGRGE